jgi:hypothetical protein
MTKIKYVKLFLQENNVIKNNSLNDFKVRVEIKFDKKDVELNSRFKLHILLYSAHKKAILPAFGFDFNESDPMLKPIDFIGFSKYIVYPVNAKRQLVLIEEDLEMVLGPAIFLEGLKVFALLGSEVSCVTRSNEYHFNFF